MSLKRYPGTRNPINQIDKRTLAVKMGFFLKELVWLVRIRMDKWVFCVFRFKLDVFIHGYFNPEFPSDEFFKQSKKDRFIYKILSGKFI